MAKKRKRTAAKKPKKSKKTRTTTRGTRSKSRRPKRAAKPTPTRKRTSAKAKPTRPRATKTRSGGSGGSGAAKKGRTTTARRGAGRAAGTKRAARQVILRRATTPPAAMPPPAPPTPDTAAPPAAGDLRSRVVAVLTMRGYDASRTPQADVLTAVAAGYGMGLASAPAWLRFDANQALAEGIVQRYETGDRSPGPDRPIHRPQVRMTVDSNLTLLGLADGTGDAEREVLTALCLGSWDPGMMTHVERDGIASFIVPWYRDGH